MRIASGGVGDIGKDISNEKCSQNVELEQNALQGSRRVTTMIKKDNFSVIRAAVIFPTFLKGGGG